MCPGAAIEFVTKFQHSKASIFFFVRWEKKCYHLIDLYLTNGYHSRHIWIKTGIALGSIGWRLAMTDMTTVGKDAS